MQSTGSTQRSYDDSERGRNNHTNSNMNQNNIHLHTSIIGVEDEVVIQGDILSPHSSCANIEIIPDLVQNASVQK